MYYFNCDDDYLKANTLLDYMLSHTSESDVLSAILWRLDDNYDFYETVFQDLFPDVPYEELEVSL